MGIVLRSGRAFEIRDRPDSEPVVIVSQATSDRLYPGEEAVGRVALVEGNPHTIVGVVANVRHEAIEADAGLEIYLPISQAGASATTMVVRTEAGMSTAAEVRAALRAVDPLLPVADLRPLEGLVAHALASRRFLMSLLIGFSGFGLVLVWLGIYGVVASTVAQRTGEIGIRMALGASPARIRSAVVTQTLALTGVGVAIGTGLALILGRLMQSLLFELRAEDPMVYAVMVAVASGVAFGAGLLPALRAARIDASAVVRRT